MGVKCSRCGGLFIPTTNFDGRPKLNCTICFRGYVEDNVGSNIFHSEPDRIIKITPEQRKAFFPNEDRKGTYWERCK